MKYVPVPFTPVLSKLCTLLSKPGITGTVSYLLPPNLSKMRFNKQSLFNEILTLQVSNKLLVSWHGLRLYETETPTPVEISTQLLAFW